jgi:hypothetical protein
MPGKIPAGIGLNDDDIARYKILPSSEGDKTFAFESWPIIFR